MMGVRDMQRYIILKSIKNAKNDKDLDKYLQRAKVRSNISIFHNTYYKHFYQCRRKTSTISPFLTLTTRERLI